MIIIVFIVVILIALKQKKSTYAAYLVLFVCLLLSISCSDGVDLYYLELSYKYPSQFHEYFAWGFDKIFYYLSDINISFIFFRFICALIILYCVFKIHRKCTCYIGFSIGIFSIFPFIGEITQIRNALSSAIILCFFVCYIKAQKGQVKYLMGTLLATSLHYSTIFYGIFVFVKIHIRRLFFLLCILSISMYVIYGFGVFPELFESIKLRRAVQWLIVLQHSTDYKSVIVLSFLHITGLIILWSACISCKLYNSMSAVVEKEPCNYLLTYDNKAIDCILNANLLLLPILGLYFISPTYFRYVQYMFIINAAILSQAACGYGLIIPMANDRYKRISKGASQLIVIIYALCMLLLIFCLGQGGVLRLFNSFSFTIL